MPHPKMFRDDDPLLARVREIAMTFPGAAEKVSHGRPNFYTTKIFVYFGGSQKVDGEWVSHEESILVLPDETERVALLGDPRVYLPAYLGPSGWIGFQLPAARAAKAKWAEVAELIDASYRSTAGKRHVAELAARRTQLSDR